jgi:hypothetical protein
LTTVPVVVVVASGLLGGRRDSKGALQLLALPHGVFSIAVELALVVHEHIEVIFEEGGRSWLFGGVESKAKNSKVAHEYAERREHVEFILVRASGE